MGRAHSGSTCVPKRKTAYCFKHSYAMQLEDHGSQFVNGGLTNVAFPDLSRCEASTIANSARPSRYAKADGVHAV